MSVDASKEPILDVVQELNNKRTDVATAASTPTPSQILYTCKLSSFNPGDYF